MINQILDKLKVKLQEITDIKEFTYAPKDPQSTPQCLIQWERGNEDTRETGRTTITNNFNIFIKTQFVNDENEVVFFNDLISQVINKLSNNKTLDGLVDNIYISGINPDNNEDTTKFRSIVFTLIIDYKQNISR